ncbi:MAG: type II toxin-antitoxin system Phd/YefM family antitoxin [Chloroflexales bacterium]
MPTRINLTVDLQRGVVPISKAASSLAALIMRARSTGQPVIVTQKGYPAGVLLSIDLFSTLKDLADTTGEPFVLPPSTASDAIEDERPEESAINDD